MSQKSKLHGGSSKSRDIFMNVALPIITVIILGMIDRLLFLRKWKRLSSSLQEDFQSLLKKQNRQTQKDLHVLAEKQDQQIAVLYTLTEESTRTPAEPETDTNWHRLTLFSDGVFAIAITLLVLDIHVPTVPYHPFYVLTDLAHLWPNILIFAYTFLYIGYFWNLHRQIFCHIKRITTKLVMFNLFVLLLIVFMPFPTSLLYEYTDTSSEVYEIAQDVGRFYAGTMVLLGLLFGLLWWYVSGKRRLLNEHDDARIVRQYYYAILIPTFFYLVSITLTFIHIIPFLPPHFTLIIDSYYNTGVDMSQIIWLFLPLILLAINLLSPLSISRIRLTKRYPTS